MAGRDRVTLAAGRDPGPLPPPLGRLDAAVRPQLPGEIQAVIKSARARTRTGDRGGQRRRARS